VAGKILNEALHINLALHYLEQVIVALHKRSKDKNVHIPYRSVTLPFASQCWPETTALCLIRIPLFVLVRVCSPQ
jgi:hypothetical protein